MNYDDYDEFGLKRILKAEESRYDALKKCHEALEAKIILLAQSIDPEYGRRQPLKCSSCKQMTALNILKNSEIKELKSTIAERDAEITRLKATITQLTAENIDLKEKEKKTFAVHNSNQDAFDEWKRRLDRSNATD